MKAVHTCLACRDFAPLDVTKGVCHRTKDLVQADAQACSRFLLMPRCGNCAQYVAGPAELGTCAASVAEPAFFAYPELAAVTCPAYRAS